MTGILKIELPDNFKKGDGKKCLLYTGYSVVDHTTNNCKYAKNRRCFPCDCPLEIQDDTDEFLLREIELMKQGKVINHRRGDNYENSNNNG